MTTATIGALRVVLGLDSATFTEGLTAAQKHLGGVGKKMQAVGATIAGVGAGLSAAITGPLIAMGATAINEAVEMREAMAQVGAGIASMGNAAGRSLDELKVQADKLAGSSLFEDDQILRGVTANLVTFGNVAGENFDRAQQAAVDLATRMKMDLQPATLLVGKALNDPIKGMTAMGRAGIQFSEDQKAAIKAMVATGDAAGAQRIILGELERQFGGSAQAARDAAHPAERLSLAFKSMAGDIGEILLPVVDKIAGVISDLAGRFGQLSPGMQKAIVIVGAVAAALGPVLIVAGGLVAAVGALIPVIVGLGAPFLAVAAAAAAVGAAFYVFRDDIGPIIEGFAKSLQDNIGPKLAPLWEALKGALAAVGTMFSAIFGDGSPGSAAETIKAFGEVVARVFGAQIDLITGAINVITNIFRAFGALLRGDFSAMWSYLGQAVLAAVRGMANAFQTLFPEVTAWVQRTYEAVKAWLLDKFTGLVRQIGEKVAAVAGFFKDLWDKVVGHSYIPDMVIAIGEWMGSRLKAAMVDPAKAATDEAAAAFEGAGAQITDTWEGVFKSIAGKDWKGALSGLFDIMGGGGGVLGALGKIGSFALGLPGFKTGGSFKVGGTGGADSQLMAFRATPGEMVDVRKGDEAQGAAGFALHVMPSKYFDVQVQKIAGPMVDQGVGRAVQLSGDLGRRSLPGVQMRQEMLGT